MKAFLEKIGTLQGVNDFFLHVIIILLPIYQKPIPLAIVLWALTSVFLFKKENFKLKKSSLLLVAFYLLLILGVAWSENKGVATFDLEVKLSLIIFPLLFSFQKIGQEKLRSLLITFILSLTLTSFLLVGQALFEFAQAGDFYMLFYSNLSPIIHPSYLSLYYCLALFILIYNVAIDELIQFRYRKLAVVLLVWLFIFNFMLLSKIGIIVSLLMAAFFILVWVNKTRNFLSGLGMILGIVLFVFMAYNKSAYFKQRIDELFYSMTTDDPTYANSSSSQRTKIWNESITLVGEKPILGHGTGDVKFVLMNKYAEKGYLAELESKLNAHNIFFQMLIATGFLGLSLFIAGLFFAWKEANITRNHYVMAFVVIFILFGLTESLLEKQAGTMFFGLFFILLNSVSLSKEQDSVTIK